MSILFVPSEPSKSYVFGSTAESRPYRSGSTSVVKPRDQYSIWFSAAVVDWSAISRSDGRDNDQQYSAQLLAKRLKTAQSGGSLVRTIRPRLTQRYSCLPCTNPTDIPTPQLSPLPFASPIHHRQTEVNLANRVARCSAALGAAVNTYVPRGDGIVGKSRTVSL